MATSKKGIHVRLNGDTVFEIGSMTKVFTSLLLAGMVQRGEVALDDPVAKTLDYALLCPGIALRHSVEFFKLSRKRSRFVKERDVRLYLITISLRAKNF